GALGSVVSCVMLMLVEDLSILVRLRLKISMLLIPSLRLTSAAQVVKQSKSTAASTTPALLIAMFVFGDFVPKRVILVLLVREGKPPKVGIAGVVEIVAGSPQSIGVAMSSPQLNGAIIQKTAHNILKTVLGGVNLHWSSIKFVLI
ncbi:MAG: hypothetical protein L0Y56_07275, partial [Nitrospira sp.]|nr:hypothetical protein [Nitrospira sp.]